MAQKSKSSSHLLQDFTRDPNYVSRLQGLEDAPHGRDWDNRFATAKIPTYDALNDRFCKFTMRRRAPSANKTNPPPQHPQLAWNSAEKTGAGGLPALRHAGQPAAQDPLLKTYPGANNTSKEDPSNTSAVPGQSIETLFGKGKQRIIKLWDELGISENQRLQFAQHAMSVPTAENVQAINDQIQRLLDRRNCAIQVEKNIEVREGFLYLLQELAERYTTGLLDKDRALREVQSLVRPLRNSGLDTIESIVRWREIAKSPNGANPVFLWKGVSYLNKMNSDLFFLIHTRLGLLLDFEVKNNPLLDPRKQVEIAATAGKLAPIRRAKEAKDVPKERLDAAERVLLEENQRQNALQSMRATGDGATDFMQEDEETHLNNLAKEETEHQQLIVEEDAWLRQQQRQAQEHDSLFKAATKIQSVYRAFVARKLVGARIRQRMAAVKIQKIARQFIAKQRTKKLHREYNAARKLQSLQRGVSTRSRIQEIRFHHHCATNIQRVFRGHLARKYTDMLSFLRYCAVKIQAAWRGCCDRKRIRRLISGRRNGAAIRIQSVWRGYTVRHNPMYSPKRIKMATKIQAWSRGIIERAFVRQLIVQRRNAVRLQAWYRMLLAKKAANQIRKESIDQSWESHIRVAVASATKIQSMARMVEAKKKVQQKRSVFQQREQEDQAKENSIANTAKQSKLLLEKQSATSIQSIFRGHVGRVQVQMIRNLNRFATQIQRIVRGFMGRRYARGQRVRLVESMTSTIMKTCTTPEPSPLSLISESVRQMKATDITDDSNMHEISQIPDESEVLDAVHDEEPNVNNSTAKVEPSTAETPADDNTKGFEESIVKTTESVTQDSITNQSTVKEVPVEAASQAAVQDAAVAEIVTAEVVIPAEIVFAPIVAPAEVAAPAVPVVEIAVAPAAPAEVVVAAPVEKAAAAAVSALSIDLDEDEAIPSEAEAISQEADYASRVISSGLRSHTSTPKKSPTAVEASTTAEEAASELASIEAERLMAARMMQRFFRNHIQKVVAPKKRVRVVDTNAILKQEVNFAVMILQVFARAILAKAVTATKVASRHSGAAADRQILIDQERAVAVHILQRFGRGIARDRTVKATTTVRVVPEQAALEQERLAAVGIMRRFYLRHCRASNKKKKTSPFVYTPRTLASEKAYAASMIQSLFHHKFPKATVGKQIAPKVSNTAADGTAVDQERDFSVRMLQKYCRRNCGRIRRRRQRNVVGEAELAQEREYAETQMSTVVRMHIAKIKVEDLKTSRHVKAVLNEVSTTPVQSPVEAAPVAPAEVAPEAPVVAAAELKGAARKASLKGVHFGVDVLDNSGKQQPLPNPKGDAPATPADADNSNLIARIEELQREVERLRNMGVGPVEQQAAADAEAKAASEQEAQVAAERQAKEAADAEALKIQQAKEAQEKLAKDAAELEAKLAREAADRQASQAAEAQAAQETDQAQAAADRKLQEAAERKERAEQRVQEALAQQEKERADAAAKAAAERKAQEDHEQQLRDAAARKAEEEAAAEAKRKALAIASRMSKLSAVHIIQGCLYAFQSADIVIYWKKKAVAAATSRTRQQAAVKIQCFSRRFLARRKCDRTRALRAEQRRQRDIASMQLANKLEIETNQRNLNNQIMYQIARTDEVEQEKRMAEVRRQDAIAMLHRSALRIQCAVRCYNARFMFQWKLKDRHDKLRDRERKDYIVASKRAATKIQSIIRMFVARRKVRRIREDRQRVKDQLRRVEQQRHAAAVKIQCMYRCFNARFEVNWKRDDRRKVELRQQGAKKTEEQNGIRFLMEKEAQQKKKGIQRAAAIKLQCAWRCYNAKFELMWRVEARAKRNAELAARKQGQTLGKTAQRVGRGFLDRRKLFMDRALARNLAAQELLLAEYEADSLINQVLDS